MLPFIDEIQMISDERVGSGWLMPFWGFVRQKSALCGEEDGVPLIRVLLKDMATTYLSG